MPRLITTCCLWARRPAAGGTEPARRRSQATTWGKQSRGFRRDRVVVGPLAGLLAIFMSPDAPRTMKTVDMGGSVVRRHAGDRKGRPFYIRFDPPSRCRG